MQKLLNFIKGQSRNKLIISTVKIDSLDPLDIGKLFSMGIKKFSTDKRLPLKAKEVLEDIFNAAVFDSKVYGKYLAIENIGILFEPELKIDVLQLFDKHSRTNTLFIQWDGEIENNTLYFLSKQKGRKIDIKNLSYIAI
jgi:hypothetical protein